MAQAQGFLQSDVVDAEFRPGWRDPASGHHFTALHLELAPGWKTYWRAPGDAGIPPSFDWGGSKNLRGVRFHWPSPEVFESSGMVTVGYHNGLVLPIEVIAEDPSKPVELRARIDLGVCKDICMPATLDIASELPPNGTKDPLILRALQAGPSTPKEARLKRITCKIEPIRDGLRVTAQIEMGQIGPNEFVVIEPGISGVWVSEAQVSRNASTLTAVAEMVPPNGAPFALDRSGVLVTVMANGAAVEIPGCPAP